MDAISDSPADDEAMGIGSGQFQLEQQLLGVG